MRLSLIQGVLIMETKLVPIYALRMLMLEQLNPNFFAARRASVLFPAPDGPSMATFIIFILSSELNNAVSQAYADFV